MISSDDRTATTGTQSHSKYRRIGKSGLSTEAPLVIPLSKHELSRIEKQREEFIEKHIKRHPGYSRESAEETFWSDLKDHKKLMVNRGIAEKKIVNTTKRVVDNKKGFISDIKKQQTLMIGRTTNRRGRRGS